MIYCSLEPGLLSLENLQPHEVRTAFLVITSLFSHKEMIKRVGARIPVTEQYVQNVLEGLNAIGIMNPPIRRNFREYVMELLANQVIPALLPTGVTDCSVVPDIVSSWVSQATTRLWVDCLTASVAEGFHSGNQGDDNNLAIATWQRDCLPAEVTLVSAQIGTFLEADVDRWRIQLLVSGHDWNILISTHQPWPITLDILIEKYARQNLGIDEARLAFRRQFRFEEPCLRELRRENDPEIRELIVEVLSRRAYDQLLPRRMLKNAFVRPRPLRSSRTRSTLREALGLR